MNLKYIEGENVELVEFEKVSVADYCEHGNKRSSYSGFS
jgi:hypothetical protein